MELLSGWMREIVVLLVFIVFLELLIPRSSVENFVRVVAGLLLLVTILKPVVVWIHDHHPMEISRQDLSHSSAGHAIDPPAFMAAAYEQGLRYKISSYLAEKGYYGASVAVNVQLNDKEAFVQSVIITMDKIPGKMLSRELCDAFELPYGVVSVMQGGKKDESKR
jgi:stage III sporulation protein AF